MFYYLALPFVFATLAPGAHAGFFDYERCFDDGDKVICPDEKEHEIRRILSITIPIALLFFFFLGMSIYYCVKKRRAKRDFTNLEAPGGGPIPPYNVAAPQMQQGYAGHWVPPSQQVPNPFQGGNPYVQQTGGNPYVQQGGPPGPPPTLAHGGSYDTDPPKNDGYASFQEVKINS